MWAVGKGGKQATLPLPVVLSLVSPAKHSNKPTCGGSLVKKSGVEGPWEGVGYLGREVRMFQHL